MATPATARRSDQGDLASTPRPSISPLSVASKPNRSPEVTRMAISAPALAPDAEVETAAAMDAADTGELDDDRSSSLSEPDDDDLEEAEDATDTIGGTTGAATAPAHDSLDVDSEAETDRLEPTPQKSRSQAEANGKTPSKLNQAAAAEDELSEPPSPLPMDTGAASSTTTIATAGTVALHAPYASLADEDTTGKKRKRSDTAESPLTSAESDFEESPRKRSHEMPAEELPTKQEESAIAEEAVEEVVEEEEVVQDTPAGRPKVVKGKKGRPRGRKAKEAATESEPEAAEEHAVAETELGAEGAAKAEQRRPEVSANFEAIAKRFATYREMVLNERIAALNYELEMLQQADCQHPEYLRQVACVDARRDKQVREAQAYYRYRFTSIRQRTLGDRAQLQSQYHQSVRQMREETMSALGEDWYNIQRERRDQHQDRDDAHIYKFPAQRSEQIKRQAKYNQEVSVLSGVAKYVGFPAAPDLEGIKGDALESDMKAMKISKRVTQPAPPSRPFYQRLPTVPTPNERLAHDQFIEQNAWAQPQRPIHNHGTPNLTHTPDWVDQPGPQGNARNLIRNLSGQVHRNSSPFQTPIPKRAEHPSSSGTVPVPSDGPEPPSSNPAAPPMADRPFSFQHAGTPQATPLHPQKQRQQHNGERDLTGFRNISGTSTIDAPPDSAEREREPPPAVKPLPALLSESSAPQSSFATSQLHVAGAERDGKEVYATVGFRPAEGAFGTPAPLGAGSRAPGSA